MTLIPISVSIATILTLLGLPLRGDPPRVLKYLMVLALITLLSCLIYELLAHITGAA